MAERLEPLQALVQRIVQRPRQRPQYTPVEFEEIDGSMRRLPEGIAGADEAQSYDISSAIAPTQPTFARGEEDDGPETPVQLASGGRGQSNPFQFASGGSQPQMRQTSGGIQYERVCDGQGKCRMVPVTGGQQGQSMALPPGVTLGPGETYVPGSLKEVSGGIRPQQPMAAAAPAQASQAPKPAAQPAAQPALEPTGRSPIRETLGAYEIMDDLTMRLDEWRTELQQSAKNYYAKADEALAARDAIGFAQNSSRGDNAMKAGNNLVQLYVMAQTVKANQVGLDRDEARQAAEDKSRTVEGLIEEESKIVTARGKSLRPRIQKLVAMRTAAYAANKQEVPPDVMKSEVDMATGEIYAADTSGYFIDYRAAKDRWTASGATDDRARADGIVAKTKAYDLMIQRFGDSPSRAELEKRMRGELTPIYSVKFYEYFQKNPSAVPKGIGGSALLDHANAEAVRAVETNIAVVSRYLEEGKSPYEEMAEAAGAGQ